MKRRRSSLARKVRQSGSCRPVLVALSWALAQDAASALRLTEEPAAEAPAAAAVPSVAAPGVTNAPSTAPPVAVTGTVSLMAVNSSEEDGQRDCVEKHSVGQCGRCFSSDYCGPDPEWFCCPFMKLCIRSSHMSCPPPIAYCRPICFEPDPAKCECTNPDFKAGVWQKPICRAPKSEKHMQLTTCAKPGDTKIDVDSIAGFTIGASIIIGEENNMIVSIDPVVLSKPLEEDHTKGTIVKIKHDPYDCREDISNWESAWSEGKKEWCCNFRNVGCKFDCQEAAETWDTSWSKEKEIWCCHNKHVGCRGEKSLLSLGEGATGKQQAAAGSVAHHEPVHVEVHHEFHHDDHHDDHHEDRHNSRSGDHRRYHNHNLVHTNEHGGHDGHDDEQHHEGSTHHDKGARSHGHNHGHGEEGHNGVHSHQNLLSGGHMDSLREEEAIVTPISRDAMLELGRDQRSGEQHDDESRGSAGHDTAGDADDRESSEDGDGIGEARGGEAYGGGHRHHRRHHGHRGDRHRHRRHNSNVDEHMHVPGDIVHSSADDPFDCHEDVANWDGSWSEGKKDWCCQNKNIACRAAAGPPEGDPPAFLEAGAFDAPLMQDAYVAGADGFDGAGLEGGFGSSGDDWR
eukprot:TRINITY_DN31089_c0_g1_i1.p1 TRINITY_DN31089_c0_g1~~TRINITY_DN31089_c0_g1_i1.p1  ORF type:complete len:625 (+),score=128.51 TRINITY_DN31089_c0_g1_i1:84-1958(+)